MNGISSYKEKWLMNLSRRNFLSSMGLTAAALAAPQALTAAAPSASVPCRPKRIIMIVADDLGYGDMGCYGAEANLTPFIDTYVNRGVRFLDAHATAATCTPSRYALFTGSYAWRKPGTGIAPGDSKLLIDHTGPTMLKMLKKTGMVTGAIGKWHLGMGPGPGKTNWNKLIKPNANDLGFDETFLMAATADRTPCVYVRNGLVENLDPNDPIEVNYHHNYPGEPDGKRDRASLKMDWLVGHNMAVVNGIGRIGYMKGGKKARWVDEDMADVFVAEAQKFIVKHKNEDFFLYLGTNDIHVPRVPHPRFVGKTKHGPRGDVTYQFDDSVRRVVETLRKEGLEKDTLLIITSDNGPVVNDGYKDRSIELLGNHKPAGQWRGGKYTPFEGGHRVPFIAVWPNVLPAGETSDTLLQLVDMTATFATLRGYDLQPGTFPDSFDQSAAFFKPNAPSTRPYAIFQDYQMNIRMGHMKYIYPQGGNSLDCTKGRKLTALDGQLYDLSKDPAEMHNLTKEQPQLATKLANLMIDAAKNGYTRPGFKK